MINIAIFLSLFSSSLLAGERLIYSPDKDVDFNPVIFYVNGAFDVTQNPYYFNQNDFFEKHEILWKRIRSPVTQVEKNGGFKKLAQDEVFSNRVLPNIGLHTMGSGYDMRMLKEYFEYKGVSYAGAWAVGMTFMVHAGNEALETTEARLNGNDHIADLFFFDIAAIPLFLNDDVVRFVVNDLGMSQWHFRPVWLLDQDNITNAGLNYIFRPKKLAMGRVQPFLYLSMQVLIGATVKGVGAYDLSLGSGMAPTDPLENKGRFATGLFVERDQKLLGSLIFNGTEDFKARLNLYPEYLSWGEHRLGFFSAYKRNKDWPVGLSYVLPIGLGTNL
jgi:hypothetical protein